MPHSHDPFDISAEPFRETSDRNKHERQDPYCSSPCNNHYLSTPQIWIPLQNIITNRTFCSIYKSIILERYYNILNIYVLISHIMTKSPDVNLELSAPELKEKWKPSSRDVCAEHWYGISDQPPRRSALWGSSPKLDAHCIATWQRYSVFISVPGRQGSFSPIFKNVFPLIGCWVSVLTSRMNMNFWLYHMKMGIRKMLWI